MCKLNSQKASYKVGTSKEKKQDIHKQDTIIRQFIPCEYYYYYCYYYY
jgi:hypothetical protein